MVVTIYLYVLYVSIPKDIHFVLCKQSLTDVLYLTDTSKKGETCSVETKDRRKTYKLKLKQIQVESCTRKNFVIVTAFKQ